MAAGVLRRATGVLLPATGGWLLAAGRSLPVIDYLSPNPDANLSVQRWAKSAEIKTKLLRRWIFPSHICDLFSIIVNEYDTDFVTQKNHQKFRDMADLRTTYMGVELKNPIILGASSLVEDPAVIQKIERAGISAIIYRSLFEEQIHLEQIQLEDQLGEYDNRNAEMLHLFPEVRHGGAKEHLYKLEKLISKVSIPVFASLNATYEESWEDYALALEKTGIAGLELNFYDIPLDGEHSSTEIEKKQLRILSKLKSILKIPISVKLSPFYSNPVHFISQVDNAGANGVVIFNRFFQPEINTDTEEFFYPFDLTHQKDYQLSLRFAGLLYGNIGADICASRGISDGKDVIKMLLAGADSVQIVSAVYKNKASHITGMIELLEEWMDARGYKTINDFKGKLSMKNLKDPYAYKRAQYVDILMKSNEILKKYPMV